MTKVVALVMALGFAIVAGFGCMKCGQNVSQKIAEKAIESAVDKTTGGRATIDVGKEVDLSGLPVFLRYSKAVATGRYSMNGTQGLATVYTFEVKDPVAPVVAFYKQALAGWKELSTEDIGDGVALAYATEDGKQQVTLKVSSDSATEVTSLTLLYSKKD